MTEDSNPFRSLASAIAIHLTVACGHTWTIGYILANHQQSLDCKALDISLFMRLTNFEKKVEISSHLGTCRRYLGNVSLPGITGTLARGAEAIAADINRKIIPDLLVQRDRCRQEEAYWQGIAAQRQQLMDRLARVLDAEAEHTDGRSVIYEYLKQPTGNCRTVVTMQSQINQVEMHIGNISPQQAAIILELLQASRLPDDFYSRNGVG